MKKLKKEKIRKINKSQLIRIGSFLIIIIGTIIVSNSLLSEYKNDKDNGQKIKEFFEVQEEIEVKEEIENVTEEVHYSSEDYIGVLEIKKINLYRGFYQKDSNLNNVNKNIKLLNESSMPDEEKGNVIFASHSGNSYVSFFRNLPKLEIDDIATIYYGTETYNYKLVNTYEIEKTGTANIVRNKEVNTLTLITCKHNTNKQLVFIFEKI